MIGTSIDLDSTAVAGGVDSGKSTLVAVLTNGRQGRPLLDNGQGSARMSVFKHKHEIETGRTSSLSHHMLAYDAEHRVLNYADVAPMMPAEIAAAASKVRVLFYPSALPLHKQWLHIS